MDHVATQLHNLRVWMRRFNLEFLPGRIDAAMAALKKDPRFGEWSILRGPLYACLRMSGVSQTDAFEVMEQMAAHLRDNKQPPSHPVAAEALLKRQRECSTLWRGINASLNAGEKGDWDS